MHKIIFFPAFLFEKRRAPIFASLLVLFALAFLLSLPQTLKYRTQKQKIINQGNFYHIGALKKITDDDFFKIRDAKLTAFLLGGVTKNGAALDQKIGETFIFDIKYLDEKSKVYFVFDNFNHADKNAKPNVDVKKFYFERKEIHKYDVLICFYNDGVLFRPGGIGNKITKLGSFIKYTKKTSFTFDDKNYFISEIYDGLSKTATLDIGFAATISAFLIPIFMTLLMYFLIKTFEKKLSFRELIHIAMFVSFISIPVAILVLSVASRIDIYTLYIPLFGVLFLLNCFMYLYFKNKEEQEKCNPEV